MYPPPAAVRAWDEFEPPLRSDRDGEEVSAEASFDVFLASSFRADRASCEEDETVFLKGTVLELLRRAGFCNYFWGARNGLSVQSKPDLVLFVGDGDKKVLVAPIEMKSTHNLLLPDAASAVTDAYIRAYESLTTPSRPRSALWANVAHPFGQIVRQMVENKRRFGVLSSATRTFFLRIVSTSGGSGGGGSACVEVTRAWLVGEEKYLRAWAHFQALARADANAQEHRDMFDHLGWSKSSPVSSPDRPRRGRGLDAGNAEQAPGPDAGAGGAAGGSAASSGSQADSGAGEDSEGAALPEDLLGVPRVPVSSVQCVRAIGTGRQGTVHLAVWQGREVAVKMFDLDHGGEEAWEQEVSAYSHLREAWGELVPRPLFTSTSRTGAVLYLGLQLGRRDPRDTALDASFYDDMHRVLDALLDRFGFEHGDPEPRNFVYVDGADGQERLVAVDLE
jgi:hypothetical protein